jgi:hypothetical protein
MLRRVEAQPTPAGTTSHPHLENQRNPIPPPFLVLTNFVVISDKTFDNLEKSSLSTVITVECPNRTQNNAHFKIRHSRPEFFPQFDNENQKFLSVIKQREDEDVKPLFYPSIPVCLSPFIERFSHTHTR